MFLEAYRAVRRFGDVNPVAMLSIVMNLFELDNS